VLPTKVTLEPRTTNLDAAFPHPFTMSFRSTKFWRPSHVEGS